MTDGRTHTTGLEINNKNRAYCTIGREEFGTKHVEKGMWKAYMETEAQNSG